MLLRNGLLLLLLRMDIKNHTIKTEIDNYENLEKQKKNETPNWNSFIIDCKDNECIVFEMSIITRIKELMQ